ncbi:CHASE2 domain-containing protein [Scytonema sp. UIC 10036]|uniref:CHASE2 domain-containing protein n=1 Tax=Scytonema sp. UIC 10036 TaxID=2304196 RepID=UPI0012DAA7B5|nr:CHASE2 domain-containing protein [Scytonema sp. UIC 10036]MUG96977.1 CHASE2 domain-containing protein [Scytonema sp. UIC 10036]
MAKLVVLKLDGDFAPLGFRVTLEIGEEEARPSTAITGLLPPAPELVTYYERWQSNYRSLMVSARMKLEKVIYDGSVDKRLETCNDSAQVLRDRLNTWLNSESFRPIREQWLKQLMPSDEIRVLVCTKISQLQKLPWHLWDLLEIYPRAEVVLSALEYERLKSKVVTHREEVRILAILGNSADIDIEKDRQLLEKLPNAATTSLVEPKLEEINDQLWKQPWDILFFAGHSSTKGDTGRIYINKTDSLTISELKYALKKVVARGLELAIFNSCDGLGLARKLLDLHIPQIIVMREPVPDKVAQEFLKHFLTTFADGESFYLAVRDSRERLHGLENEFPCASWCPVICQNPAEVPLTWQELCGRTESKYQFSLSSHHELRTPGRIKIDNEQGAMGNKLFLTMPHAPRPMPYFQFGRIFRTALQASVAIASLVMGVRYLGMLQTLELKAFDQLMQLRPDEPQDPRLLVITVNEQDIQYQDHSGMERRGSLSDSALDRLLQKLETYKPRAIGLNIYRDFPSVNSTPEELDTRLKQNKNFFAICKVSDSEANNPGISPPPKIPVQRQGFSESVRDSDAILRRHLLAMISLTSPCTAPYALSAQLAFHYLEKNGISAKYTPQGDLQLGNVVFKRLRSHMGGYQQVDARGYQILLNYRSYGRSPEEIAPTATLTDVLKGAVKPEEVKNRIVLIGITARSADAYISTPYRDSQGFKQEIPGVIVQAQMVSQILSAVLDKRPLLSVWPFWGEVLWVWGWSVVGGILVWRYRSPLHLGMAGGGVLLVLYVLCFRLFTYGIWVPLVPSALAIVVTGSSVLVYTRSQSQRQQHTSVILNHD